MAVTVTVPALPLPFTRTPHLVGLVAEAEGLAKILADATPGDQVVGLWSQAVLASLHLDGSTIPAAPTREQVAAAIGVPNADQGASRGGWHRTLRSAVDPDVLARQLTQEAPDQTVWTREYQGVMTALASDDLADRLLRDPVDALAGLHRRLTAGLLAQDRAGTPRLTEQAVHDMAVGRVLYFAPEPADVPRELHRLAGWLASGAAREHGLVVSGVLHLELLRIHPFEAANGRLARAAARLVLRARGLDPGGLAVAEIPLAQDALGTYEEVARTTRRRDLTIWLERWGEAVTAGQRHAARHLGLLAVQVPDRAAAFLAAHTEREFTVMDYRSGARVGPEEARADLATLLDAGSVVRVPGSRGLRFHLV